MHTIAPICCLLVFFVSGCAALPQLAQTVDDIATDGVVQVQIDKEAFQKNKNVKVCVEISDAEMN